MELQAPIPGPGVRTDARETAADRVLEITCHYTVGGPAVVRATPTACREVSHSLFINHRVLSLKFTKYGSITSPRAQESISTSRPIQTYNSYIDR